jgi:retron-type reverse transcriptase
MACSYNIWSAWRRFRVGKRPSHSIDEYEYHLVANLDSLARGITNGTYRHGGYQHALVSEKKRRDLAVAAVRDRVVHRLVHDELVQLFDHRFDPDVWSCRKGKGLHACLARTQQLLKRHPYSYVWRADITKFFDNIDHQVLKTCLRRVVQETTLLYLCDEIINSYYKGSPNKGVPIGNLTSQIFANVYLNEFDRYVRHQLKPLSYVRYGDDALLFYPTRRAAKQARAMAGRFLKSRLGLTINPKNDVVVPAQAGLHWLGHAVTARHLLTDRHTTLRALAKVNQRNIASYKALNLAKWPKKQLDWQVLDEITDEIEYYS